MDILNPMLQCIGFLFLLCTPNLAPPLGELAKIEDF